MTADDFAKLPLLGDEDVMPIEPPTFRPNKGTGHKKNKPKDNKEVEVTEVGLATPSPESIPSVEPVSLPISDPSAAVPETPELTSLQSFMDAFSGIFEVMPDYANDAGRLATYASKILPVKPPITAILVGAVAGLAAYAALGRRKQ